MLEKASQMFRQASDTGDASAITPPHRGRHHHHVQAQSSDGSTPAVPAPYADGSAQGGPSTAVKDAWQAVMQEVQQA